MKAGRRRFTDPDLEDLWGTLQVLQWCVAAQGVALIIVVLALWIW